MRLRPASWMVSKVMRNRLGCAVRSFLGTWPSKLGLLIVLCHAQNAAIFFKEEGKQTQQRSLQTERENENQNKNLKKTVYNLFCSTNTTLHPPLTQQSGATLMR